MLDDKPRDAKESPLKPLQAAKVAECRQNAEMHVEQCKEITRADRDSGGKPLGESVSLLLDFSVQTFLPNDTVG